MKTRNAVAVAVIGVAMAALAGCAAQPEPTTQVASNQAVEATSVQCDQATGSRIRGTPKENCAPLGYPFRSYTSDELNATGEMDLGEALRTLDPSFR